MPMPLATGIDTRPRARATATETKRGITLSRSQSVYHTHNRTTFNKHAALAAAVAATPLPSPSQPPWPRPGNSVSMRPPLMRRNSSSNYDENCSLAQQRKNGQDKDREINKSATHVRPRAVRQSTGNSLLQLYYRDGNTHESSEVYTHPDSYLFGSSRSETKLRSPSVLRDRTAIPRGDKDDRVPVKAMDIDVFGGDGNASIEATPTPKSDSDSLTYYAHRRDSGCFVSPPPPPAPAPAPQSGAPLPTNCGRSNSKTVKTVTLPRSLSRKDCSSSMGPVKTLQWPLASSRSGTGKAMTEFMPSRGNLLDGVTSLDLSDESHDFSYPTPSHQAISTPRRRTQPAYTQITDPNSPNLTGSSIFQPSSNDGQAKSQSLLGTPVTRSTLHIDEQEKVRSTYEPALPQTSPLRPGLHTHTVLGASHSYGKHSNFTLPDYYTPLPPAPTSTPNPSPTKKLHRKVSSHKLRKRTAGSADVASSPQMPSRAPLDQLRSHSRSLLLPKPSTSSRHLNLHTEACIENNSNPVDPFTASSMGKDGDSTDSGNDHGSESSHFHAHTDMGWLNQDPALTASINQSPTVVHSSSFPRTRGGTDAADPSTEHNTPKRRPSFYRRKRANTVSEATKVEQDANGFPIPSPMTEIIRKMPISPRKNFLGNPTTERDTSMPLEDVLRSKSDGDDHIVQDSKALQDYFGPAGSEEHPITYDVESSPVTRKKGGGGSARWLTFGLGRSKSGPNRHQTSASLPLIIHKTFSTCEPQSRDLGLLSQAAQAEIVPLAKETSVASAMPSRRNQHHIASALDNSLSDGTTRSTTVQTTIVQTTTVQTIASKPCPSSPSPFANFFEPREPEEPVLPSVGHESEPPITPKSPRKPQRKVPFISPINPTTNDNHPLYNPTESSKASMQSTSEDQREREAKFLELLTKSDMARDGIIKISLTSPNTALAL